MKSITISTQTISDDPAIRKVIDAQSRLKAAQRENAALRKDRDDLLAEWEDMRKARPVPVITARKKSPTKADRVRVSFGDVHGMMMDAQAVQAMLGDIKRLDPDEVVIGGDLLECGGFLATKQPIGFIALCEYSYQEDLAAANNFLDELRDAAPHAAVHYVEGNHEDRVERWIIDVVRANRREAEFLYCLYSPENLLRLKDRGIPYYRRSVVYGDGLPRGWVQLGKMMFTHQLTGSRNAAHDAVGKTAGNITFFHTHREDTYSMVFPSVGLAKAFNPGCLCSMQPVWQNSNPTTWSQGYAVDYIAKSGNFQRIQVPIWQGESLAVAMVERFKS